MSHPMALQLVQAGIYPVDYEHLGQGAWEPSRGWQRTVTPEHVLKEQTTECQPLGRSLCADF